MKTLYTLIKETATGFEVLSGESQNSMRTVGSEPTYRKANAYQQWFLASMVQAYGYQVSYLGFAPLVPMQGHIPGH